MPAYSKRRQYDRVFHSSTENLVRVVYFPVTYAMCSCHVDTLISGPWSAPVLANSTIMSRSVPLATHRLLPSRVTLLSNATMRRLRRPDAPSRRPCLELGRRFPDAFQCFAAAGRGMAPHGPGRCSLGCIPFRDCLSTGRGRPSQVPGIPPYTFALRPRSGHTGHCLSVPCDAVPP